MSEARRRAYDIVREAETQAVDCQQVGARAGYEAGFCQALALTLNYLRECRRTHLLLREQLERDVHQALLDLIGDPELVLRLAKDLATRRIALEQQPMRVIVPKRAHHLTASVRKELAASYPDVEVERTNTDAFIVEWGEVVLEFAPSQFVDQISQQALRACDDAIAAMNGDALARSLLASALAQLQQCDGADVPTAADSLTGEI
ncbi:hypothetical protein AQ914_04575 [Burkholderia pseudomallei]|nr:hypothetical protein AQ914_04575 [Burkholderia pseudomallei]